MRIGRDHAWGWAGVAARPARATAGRGPHPDPASAPSVRRGSGRAVTAGHVALEVVPIDKPGNTAVIVGQAHFIKTVEDLHEALAGAHADLRFGLAFCEASGDCLVRRSGNARDLIEVAR